MGPVLLRKKVARDRVAFVPSYHSAVTSTCKVSRPEQAEDGTMRYPDEGFMKKNFWQKTWVLIGGVVANFILAVLLLASVVTVEPNSTIRQAITGEIPETPAVFHQIVPGSAAERFGLEAGDVVLRLNGLENPSITEVQETIRSTSQLNLLVQRG